MEADAVQPQSKKSKRIVRPRSAGWTPRVSSPHDPFLDYICQQITQIRQKDITISQKIKQQDLNLGQYELSCDLQGDKLYDQAQKTQSEYSKQLEFLKDEKQSLVENYYRDIERKAQQYRLDEQNWGFEWLKSQKKASQEWEGYDFLLHLFLNQQSSPLRKNHTSQFQSMFQRLESKIASNSHGAFDQQYYYFLKQISDNRSKCGQLPASADGSQSEAVKPAYLTPMLEQKLVKQGIYEFCHAQRFLLEIVIKNCIEMTTHNRTLVIQLSNNWFGKEEQIAIKEAYHDYQHWGRQMQRLYQTLQNCQVQLFQMKKYYWTFDSNLTDFYPPQSPDNVLPKDILKSLEVKFEAKDQSMQAKETNTTGNCTDIRVHAHRIARLSQYYIHTHQIMEHYQQAKERYKGEEGTYYQRIVKQSNYRIEICKKRLIALTYLTVDAEWEGRDQLAKEKSGSQAE